LQNATIHNAIKKKTENGKLMAKKNHKPVQQKDKSTKEFETFS
jgi:hypothetical protein